MYDKKDTIINKESRKSNYPPKKKSTSNKTSKKGKQKKSLKKILHKTNINIVFNKYESQLLSLNKIGSELTNRVILDKKKNNKINDNQIINNNNLNDINGVDNNKDKKLDNFELNELEYYEAIELDKRQFYQIYWAILMREHLILFTFFSWKDYNIIYLK